VVLPLVGCHSTPPSHATTGSIKIGSFWASSKNCGLIHDVRPVYPKEAKKLHIQGEVKLRIVVSKTGEVGKLDLISGNPALAPAAIAAVKQWRFAPCRLNGEPIEVKTEIIVPFNADQ